MPWRGSARAGPTPIWSPWPGIVWPPIWSIDRATPGTSRLAGSAISARSSGGCARPSWSALPRARVPSRRAAGSWLRGSAVDISSAWRRRCWSSARSAGCRSPSGPSKRQARVARALLALSEATRLRDLAKEKPEVTALWLAAEKGVSDANRAVDEAGVQEVAQRLAVLGGEVRSGLEAARRDRALLDAVAKLRSSKQDQRHSGADAEYARAFGEAGLDVDRESPEAVGAKLRARPGALDAAVAALDDWALERRAGKQPLARWREPAGGSPRRRPRPLPRPSACRALAI